MPGRDWTFEEIETAVTVMRGPHVSVPEPDAILQLGEELEHKIYMSGKQKWWSGRRLSTICLGICRCSAGYDTTQITEVPSNLRLVFWTAVGEW